MRINKRLCRIVPVLLLLMIGVSCDRFPTDPDLSDPRDALYVIVEAHALKQLWIYHYFETFSNGYEQGQLFAYEPTDEELEALTDELNMLLQYKDDVIAATQTLTDSLGLTPSPLSKTSGIFGSLFSFFSEGAEVGERSRERILLVVSNMTSDERNNLFNNQLRSTWRREFTDADDFWTKLQNGDIDDKASSIYNDFYDNSDLNNNFVSLANDKNLSPGNIFVKEGASLTEKGMDVVIEATKIVTPLGKGMDIVDDGKKWWEKAEKAVNKPLELVGDEIKERVAGKLAGMVDIDGVVNAVGLGEKTANAVKILSDISFGTDDTQELYENAIDWGIAKISNPETSVAQDVIVAENTETGTSFPDIVLGVGNYVNRAGEILMALPEGDWNIKSVDRTGSVMAAPVTTITAGSETAVVPEPENDYLDELVALLETMPYVSVYLKFGNESIYIANSITASIRYPLSWGGKSFGQSFTHTVTAEDNGGTIKPGTKYDNNINGHITLVSFDRAGVSLTAQRTSEIPFASNNPEIQRKIIQEITISSLPFAYFAGGLGVTFEIDSYSNRELQGSLSSIASFSYRDIIYAYSYEQGDYVVSSDTTYTEITDTDPRLRVYFYK